MDRYNTCHRPTPEFWVFSTEGGAKRGESFPDILMRASEDKRADRPEIIESYKDYEPPAKLRRVVEVLLESTPPNHLAGLKAVVLTNKAALTRNQRRQKVWSRNRKYPLAKARGAYYAETRSRPATVWLFVDNMITSSPTWLWSIPLIPYVELSEVLYHEIGHHIHAAHRPVYEGNENVAEDWSLKLSGRFLMRHYWYLTPVLYPLALFYNLAKRIKKVSARWRR
jgi:hypothetical protein